MTQKAPSPENPSATVDDIVSALNDMKALNIEIMDVETLRNAQARHSYSQELLAASI